jgi:hypothetical protein
MKKVQFMFREKLQKIVGTLVSSIEEFKKDF